MTTDLQHISGKNNVVADALSQVFTIANQLIDWSTFATDQGTDPNIPLFAAAITGLKIDHVMVAGHSIVCDISSGLPRPLVPIGPDPFRSYTQCFSPRSQGIHAPRPLSLCVAQHKERHFPPGKSLPGVSNLQSAKTHPPSGSGF